MWVGAAHLAVDACVRKMMCMGDVRIIARGWRVDATKKQQKQKEKQKETETRPQKPRG